jgi:tetratricopeptide (TPR) repeat protein
VTTLQPVPLGLLNNLCVIAANLGQSSDPSKLEEALILLIKRGLRALKSIGFSWHIGEEVPTIPSACVTFLFNFACILDLNRRDDDAYQLLLALARDHPLYTDAMMRISSILQRRGNYKGASLWLHMCLKIDPSRDDVRFGLAMVHLMARDPKSAEQIIHPLLQAKNWPPFAAAFMAHIRESWADKRDKAKLKRSLWHSQRLLTQVLKAQTQVGNVYAASALGVVLARSNHFSEALQVFKLVWEMHPEQQFFWENLALTQLHTGDFKRARQTLEAAIGKFGRTSSYLCTLAAAAQFKCEDYRACRRELLLLQHSEPFDVSIAYNITLVAYEALKSSMNKIQADRQFREQHSRDEKVLKPLPVDKKTLLQQGSDLQSSLELLQAASSTFTESTTEEAKRDFAALLVEARSHATLVDGYCAYMDGIDSEMQSNYQDAVKFLDEDKYMKLAQQEQEALRIAQEMKRMAHDGDEYALFCAAQGCVCTV